MAATAQKTAEKWKTVVVGLILEIVGLPCRLQISKLFQGEYVLPGGSTYLLVNKYWGSSYFPVNNYSGVIFFRGVFINGYTGVSIVDFEQVNAGWILFREY